MQCCVCYYSLIALSIIKLCLLKLKTYFTFLYFVSSNCLCTPTAESKQLASSGSSSVTAKKKTPVLSEEVPVERTKFQLKGDESSGVSSTTPNDDVTQKTSQLCLEKNNVKVAKPCLPEEYKPESWMLADEESGVLSQLNLAIVGHHSCLL